MERDELKQLAQEHHWPDLQTLWERLTVTTDSFNEWGGKGNAFQYLIIRAFELSEGTDEIQYPFSVGFPLGIHGRGPAMEEIDGFVRCGHISCLIESKNESEAIDVEPIAKIRNKLLRRPAATVASIFSMRGYTFAAQTLVGYCAPQTIILWDSTEIRECLIRCNMAKRLADKFYYIQRYGHQFDAGQRYSNSAKGTNP